MTKCTQASFGRHIGVGQSAVSKLVAAGVLDLTKGTEFNRLAYCRHLREVAAQHRGEDGLDLIAERAKLTRVQTELAQLKKAELEGSLVPVEDVVRKMHREGNIVRDTLLSIPSKIAAELVGITDLREITAVLDAEFRASLFQASELVEEMNAKLKAAEQSAERNAHH